MMCGKLDGKAAGYETKDRPEGLGRSFAGHWMAATSTGGKRRSYGSRGNYQPRRGL